MPIALFLDFKFENNRNINRIAKLMSITSTKFNIEKKILIFLFMRLYFFKICTVNLIFRYQNWYSIFVKVENILNSFQGHYLNNKNMFFNSVRFSLF